MTDRIAYDPSYKALFQPHLTKPLPMDDSWFATPDAIMAEFSRLAYFRFESDPAAQRDVARAVAQLHFAAPRYFWDRRPGAGDDHFDAQAFAAMSPDLAVVAFRGTQADSTEDVFTDAAATLVEWPGAGMVHWGFWGSLQTILPDIMAWLGTIGDRKLVITGHSLGAAMATLLAGLDPRAVLVNFGSPRVGDEDFARSFAGRAVRRYVDCTDGVTILPPDSPFYRHVAGCRYIDHRAEILESEPGFAERLADQALAEAAYAPSALKFFKNPPSRRLADHAPINYISAILGVRTGP